MEVVTCDADRASRGETCVRLFREVRRGSRLSSQEYVGGISGISGIGGILYVYFMSILSGT